nr:DDE-type integrase/transposase/recombinase [Microbacterium ulmi]
MAQRTAWRLCRGNDVRSAAHVAPQDRGRAPSGFERAEVLPHELTASRPGVLWLARLTEHGTTHGKRHLCLIRDMFSRRVVGYAVGERTSASLAVAAIDDAVARMGDPVGCTLWSDKGSQFQSRAFSRALSRHGLVPSPARVGADDDQEHAEAAQFFAVLQSRGLAPR